VPPQCNVSLRNQTASTHKSTNPLSYQMMPVIALWQITAEPVGGLDDYRRDLSPRWLGNRENCIVNLRGGHGDAERPKLSDPAHETLRLQQ